MIGLTWHPSLCLFIKVWYRLPNATYLSLHVFAYELFVIVATMVLNTLHGTSHINGQYLTAIPMTGQVCLGSECMRLFLAHVLLTLHIQSAH